MQYSALIPVKSLTFAKSRLADHLNLQQRQNLVLDMLHHVLRVLLASECFTQISVVSPDPRVLALVHSWKAQALAEEVPGHNEALHAAALRERRAGTEALLTISADLPLLHVDDIRALLELSEQHDVVLAASRDGTGTNALLAHPPLALPYLFGSHSLQRYQLRAKRQEVSCAVWNSIGLALDIDTIDDLDDLYELQMLSGEQLESWQSMAYCR
jgi:2-phospho-L-lactate guanylyltransferase